VDSGQTYIRNGRVLGGDQAITPQQALAAYTINAAYQFGIEKENGSLELGKLADFVVLDKNTLKVPLDEIRDITVLTTVRGDRVTFSSALNLSENNYPSFE